MTADHTAACEDARAGHFHEGHPDPWPKIGSLSADQREAVAACPHWTHDTVRPFLKFDGGAELS